MQRLTFNIMQKKDKTFKLLTELLANPPQNLPLIPGPLKTRFTAAFLV